MASQRGKLLTIPHMIAGYTMCIDGGRALFEKREWTKANERRSREEARRVVVMRRDSTLERARRLERVEWRVLGKTDKSLQ